MSDPENINEVKQHETQSFEHQMDQMVEKFRQKWVTGTPEQRAKFSAENVYKKQLASLAESNVSLHIRDQLEMIIKEMYRNLKKVMADNA